MELKEIRVQNYKKIQDTGWIGCERLTVFVGKNESGKTALFHGLSKLKSTDNAKYDPIKEFPHGRYTDEFKKKDWPVASAKYLLSEEDREELAGICEYLAKTEYVITTKHYSDKVSVEYNPKPDIKSISCKEYSALLEKVKKEIDDSVAPEGKGDAWKSHKDILSNYFAGQMNQVQQSTFNVVSSHIESIRQQVTSHANEPWMKDMLQALLRQIDDALHVQKTYEAIKKADEWVYTKIPYFLYFGNYEILASNIYLPEFINRINNNDKSAKTRVQLALFKHVGIDIKALAGLGRHSPNQSGCEDSNIRKQIDELAIKANSASIAMTKKFSDWWEQRRHKFTYKFNGDYFRVWISDDLEPADVELEERSLGLQYFFSFYLLFLVEAEEGYRDCILLLDEPGIHLHGTAQKKLIEFLDKISIKNQTFYTTHSPFMIDGNHLERARAVYETKEGTLVSSDVWPRDKDTLFPLQAALGYSICQSLFIARKQVMVEGMTDYMLLCVLNQQLKEQGKGLNEDIILIPMGGTTNLAPLSSMLIGHDIQLGILLDSDPAGLGSMQKIRKLLADVDKRCVLVSQVCERPDVSELEDMIPEKYYLDAFARAYLQVKLSFNSEEKAIPQIVDRIAVFFKRNNIGKFEKWRPIREIIQDVNSKEEKVPAELYEVAEKVFVAFNDILKT